MPRSHAIAVFVTCPDRLVAARIAKHLVGRRLAACVSIIAGVKSLFWWQGKVEACSEALLIIKTKSTFFQRLRKAVKSIHPYEIPEIIALNIDEGDLQYLAWISRSVSL